METKTELKAFEVTYIDQDNDTPERTIVHAREKQEASRLVKKQPWCYRVLYVKELPE